ncbi:MAG: hypothetical protein PHY47_16100 [Lachnospiraceae bacterium]|nr:hypothetical protein [Lachnospiraceae bacterium]
MMQHNNPSEEIEGFINFIAQCQDIYRISYDNVGKEDKRLQDLLHEMEFSQNAKERNRAATKLKNSRKLRRENKDQVLMLENIIMFFDEPQHRKVLNQLRELMGKQRKQEKMLQSERTYRPRVEE